MHKCLKPVTILLQSLSLKKNVHKNACSTYTIVCSDPCSQSFPVPFPSLLQARLWDLAPQFQLVQPVSPTPGNGWKWGMVK